MRPEKSPNPSRLLSRKALTWSWYMTASMCQSDFGLAPFICEVGGKFGALTPWCLLIVLLMLEPRC